MIVPLNVSFGITFFLLIFSESGTQISELLANTESVDDLRNQYAGPFRLFKQEYKRTLTYIIVVEEIKLVETCMPGNASMSLKPLAAGHHR